MTPQSHPAAAPHVIERPIMTQRWTSLAYMHWRYPPAEVQALLPEPLEVDVFDDSAWVGLIPFQMSDIAFTRMPPVPYFGTFPETNVRTYVRGSVGPGVWFHSLDITRLLPVAVARTTYRLPYTWSQMAIERRGDVVAYRTYRRWPRPHARSSLAIRIGERIAEPTELDHFLSARWLLYTQLGSRLAVGRVWHEPWPLHTASVVSLDDELVTAAGYSPPVGTPHTLFSPGVSVRIDRPRFTERTS